MQGREDSWRNRRRSLYTGTVGHRPSAAALIQLSIAALVVVSCLIAPARASEPPTTGLYIHVGPGALLFSPSAKVKTEGVVIPGATINLRNEVTGIVEFGYQRGSFGVSLAVGGPPLATIHGADALAPLGALGRIRYGMSVLAAQYHFGTIGRFRPYVGAGPVLLLVFSSQDVAVRNLKVRNNVGAAVQAGAEFDLDQRWSLFFDVKKAYLRTNGQANLGPVPLAAKIRLDPTAISGGVSYRF